MASKPDFDFIFRETPNLTFCFVHRNGKKNALFRCLSINSTIRFLLNLNLVLPQSSPMAESFRYQANFDSLDELSDGDFDLSYEAISSLLITSKNSLSSTTTRTGGYGRIPTRVSEIADPSCNGNVMDTNQHEALRN